MKNVNKSVLIWYSPEEMFALVADVASYPVFLPWCSHTKVLEQDDSGMTAEVGMSMGALKKSFVTRNVHEGKRKISMRLVKGPFSRLEGHWIFHPVGDGSQRACKVELQLDYGFDSNAIAALIGPIFDRIANSMVDAFIKRAEKSMADPLQIELVWVDAQGQVQERSLQLAQGATLAQALEAQALCLQAQQACGVWGRVKPLDHVLQDGDRVELYQPLKVDPKVARRERFAQQGARGAGLFAARRPNSKAGY